MNRTINTLLKVTLLLCLAAARDGLALGETTDAARKLAKATADKVQIRYGES